MPSLDGSSSAPAAKNKRELGMRIALGAMPRDVLSMVVRQELRISIIGVALGWWSRPWPLEP